MLIQARLSYLSHFPDDDEGRNFIRVLSFPYFFSILHPRESIHAVHKFVGDAIETKLVV